MAFRYPDCEFCANHDNDPTVCDECQDADEFEPYDDDASLAAETIHFHPRLKEAA